MTSSIDDYRRFYAEEIRFVANLDSPALVEAFARVPREKFIGPGPWQVGSPEVRALAAAGFGKPSTSRSTILVSFITTSSSCLMQLATSTTASQAHWPIGLTDSNFNPEIASITSAVALVTTRQSWRKWLVQPGR
jgi:hypothetical protein